MSEKRVIEVEYEGATVSVEVLNPQLIAEAISPCPPDESCPECRERGFQPRVFAEDCPACYGNDPYGNSVFCAACEYCCGC